MKKLFTSFAIAALILFTSGISFSQTISQRTLDIGGDDYFNVIKSDGSGGFYLAGSTGISGNYNASFVHSTNTATTAFSYGSTGTEFGTQLATLADGNVLLTGRSNSWSSNNSQDVFLTKINPTNGSVLWSKAIHTDSIDLGYKATNSSDGNILVVGPTGNSKTDIMLLKIDNIDGHVIFARKIGFPFSNEVPFEIKDQGPGNGVLVSGFSGAGILGMNDMFVAILDDLGHIQFLLFFGGSGDDEARVINTDEPGYAYIAGNTLSYGAGGQDFSVLKLYTGAGFPVVKWFKTYGGSNGDGLTSFEKNSNGFLLGGITSSYGSGGDGLLVQIDTAGNVLWAKNEGSNGGDVIQGLLFDATNNINLTTGYTNSYNGGSNNDGYLIKTDLNGNSGTCFGSPNIVGVPHTINDSVQMGVTVFTSDTLIVTQVNTNISAVALTATIATACPSTVGVDEYESGVFAVYPNPFTDNFTINTNFSAAYSIEVYDMNSRLVYSSISDVAQSNIDLSDVPAGVYFLICNNEKSIEKMKIVKY